MVGEYGPGYTFVVWFPLSQTSPGIYVSAVQVFFENTEGKGEIAHNEQFLLFSQCFLPNRWIAANLIEFNFVVCKLFQFGSV